MADEDTGLLVEESAPSQTDDSAFELGADIAGSGEQDASPTSSGSHSEFDPDSVDLLRADPDKLPPEYRRVQKLAKQFQADYTRKSQEIAELRRQLETRPQQNNGNTELAKAIERLAPKEDKYSDLRSRIPEEDQQAIDIVREIVKRETAEQQLPPQYVNELAQVKQTLTAIAQYVQQQRVAQASSQLQEAVQRFGEDNLQRIAPTLSALVRAPNPATGRPYTVSEAAELLLGKTQARAEQMRETDRTERVRAKRAASGATGVKAEGKSELTDNEVLAALREAGFQ